MPIRRGVSRYEKSAQLLRRAHKVVTSSRPDLEGLYPRAFQRGIGSQLFDYDGNSYLDFTAATGAVILGYADSRVDEAAAKAASRGGNLPMQITDLQVELAETLTQMTHADRAMFFRTGSDACTAAVRLCRTHSQRRLVLSSGYHGFHDWQLNIYPQFKFLDSYTRNFGYNLNLLESLLKNNSDIACVVVTPEPNFFPASYWQELRSLTDTHNVLLVFDEIMTGFRYGMLGFHHNVGVKPDLFVLGKGLANGYGISAVMGNSDVMLSRERTHLWSTFNGEMGPYAAALATIKICVEENVPYRLAVSGVRLSKGLSRIFRRRGIKAELKTRGPVFHVILEDDRLWQHVVDSAFDLGIVFSRFDAQVMMSSHSSEEVDRALNVVEGILDARIGAGSARKVSGPVTRVSTAVLDKRTFFEFGGRTEYRAPPEAALRHALRLKLSNDRASAATERSNSVTHDVRIAKLYEAYMAQVSGEVEPFDIFDVGRLVGLFAARRRANGLDSEPFVLEPLVTALVKLGFGNWVKGKLAISEELVAAANRASARQSVPYCPALDRLNQAPLSSSGRQHRLKVLCEEYPYVHNLRLGILGDDDMLSLDLAAMQGFRPVVFEIDERICDRIREVAAREALDVTVHQVDVRQGLPDVTLDTFICDPPYRTDYVLGFIRAGVRALSSSSSDRFLVTMGTMMLGRQLYKIQSEVLNLGFYVERTHLRNDTYRLPYEARAVSSGNLPNASTMFSWRRADASSAMQKRRVLSF